MALTVPEKPALHWHPTATLVPVELGGHAAAAHEFVKKGLTKVGITTPTKPGVLQVQPEITSVPAVPEGQGAAVHAAGADVEEME